MFLGIDVGTGGTRAVLIDRAGKVLASHSADHAPVHSEHIGWAEQDPEDWWRAAQDAILGALKAAAAAGHGSKVEAIGLTGQMHGCVMLDADGQVLRPALIWCDQRTQPQSDWLTHNIGYEKLIELVANPALPNFTLTKLLWVRKHQPEIFARIAHVLCPKDYVRFRLTGVYAMDMQEASGTLLLDVAHRRWSEEVADAAGIPMSWLPPLFEGPEICARISPEGAAATGLQPGTPVAAGAGDQGAGAVGMGILAPGSVSATIGTSGVVFAATAQPTFDPKGRLHTFCHAAPGIWHVMGVTNGAGLSFRYFRDTFMPTASYDELTAARRRRPTRLRRPPLGTLPLRRAHPAPRPQRPRRLRRHHRLHHPRPLRPRRPRRRRLLPRGHLHALPRARHPVDKIRLGGGGARGPLWRQIQADVYDHPVEILEAEEGGAFGAALLAGTGVNAWPTVAAACEATIRPAATIAPKNADAMAAAYARFRKLYPALKSVEA